MLPDRELPELDDVLAANVDPGRDYEALSIRAELLHRYASPAVSARVLSRIDDDLHGDGVPAASGASGVLRSRGCRSREGHCWTAHWHRERTPAATRPLLRGVATLRMTPAVEAVAVAHLEDPDPQVVINAAETLGRYGSPASAQALRAQFDRWHRAWEGRQDELGYSRATDRPNAMQGMVEHAFLQALGQGQGWLTEDADLRELRTLCVTDNCRTQADQIIAAAGDTRITISRVDDPDNSIVSLAQYQLASIPALRQKLAQYPKGTSFTLDVSALDPQYRTRHRVGPDEACRRPGHYRATLTPSLNFRTLEL